MRVSVLPLEERLQHSCASMRLNPQVWPCTHQQTQRSSISLLKLVSRHLLLGSGVVMQQLYYFGQVYKDQASPVRAVALCFFSLVGNFRILVNIKRDFINDFSYHIFGSARPFGSFTASGLWMGPVKPKDFTWQVRILLNQVGTLFFFFFFLHLEPKNNCQNILGNWAMQSIETDAACVFLFPKLLWKLPKWCCLTESWASGNDRTFQQQKFIRIVLNSCFPFLSSPPSCGVLPFNAN